MKLDMYGIFLLSRGRQEIMNDINNNKLTEKIMEVYKKDSRAAEILAKELTYRCPKQLYVNIREWINGEEISDIYIGNYSIPFILCLWGRDDFVRALDVMIELSEGHVKQAETKIWDMRR